MIDNIKNIIKYAASFIIIFNDIIYDKSCIYKFMRYKDD